MDTLPKLVNAENFKVQPQQSIKMPKREAEWYLNISLLVGFVLFLIFFLYNCKYGMFKAEDVGFVPYNFNSV